MSKKRLFFIIGAVVILLTSIVVGAVALNSSNSSNSVFNEKDGLIGQGTIESKDVSINSKIPGRIKKINVIEGQAVNAGDVLVEISSDELQAKREQVLAQINAAQAAYDAAVSQVAQAKAGYDAAKEKVTEANAGVDASKRQEEIVSSTKSKADNGAREQEIAQAQAAYDLYKATYERVEKLYEKGAVSAQKLDEVKTQLTVAQQQLSMAKEGARSEDKSAAQSGVDMAQAGVNVSISRVSQATAGLQAALAQLSMAQDGVTGKKAQLDQANGGLQEIDAYLKDTQILAPINGVITSINSSEGELVSSGMSIGTISDLSDSWVEVKVKETDLEKIVVGQKVDVKVLSFSKKKFSGTVVTINKKPDFATKRATNENGQFDIISFGVKIDLENSEEILRPGMTAYVQFKN